MRSTRVIHLGLFSFKVGNRPKAGPSLLVRSTMYMANRLKWMRPAFASVLVLTAAAPLSLADDRCDRRSYHRRDDRAYYSYTDRGYSGGPAYPGYRESGYGYGYAAPGYRDDSYRDYGYRNDGYYGYGDYQRQRPAGKSAAIIGGTAAAGAAVGAIAGGGRGAAIGAAVGALGGLIFDRSTKD